MTNDRTSSWDGLDIGELMDLAQPQPWRFRSRIGEINENGRVYGGQLLGQSLMAAAKTVPADRRATALQFMFLSGAMPEWPIDYEVTALQDGKRFSTRNVKGSQRGGRNVCDVHVSFATPIELPAHMARPAPDCGLGSDPERLPRLCDIVSPRAAEIESVVVYLFNDHPAIDFRVPFEGDLLSPDLHEPRLRFWVRMRRALPDDASLHAAAFAYLSDYWINFVGCAAHVHPMAKAGRRLYIASLNHALWWHRPVRADDWLLFDCLSPSSATGRSLSLARIYNRGGDLVASANQESLLAPVSD